MWSSCSVHGLLGCRVGDYLACQNLRSDSEILKAAPPDYILENLAEPLRLEDLAKVAHFSPFHFHRVFRSLVGETLNQFVNSSPVESGVDAHIRARSLIIDGRWFRRVCVSALLLKRIR